MRWLSAGSLVSKELQKHAIELIPARPGSLELSGRAISTRDYASFTGPRIMSTGFMGLGMHPLLDSG